MRHCTSDDQVARLRGDVQGNHGAVRTAVNNRLQLIEDPQPNTRMESAMKAVESFESTLLSGSSSANCDQAERLYRELNDACAYLPPIMQVFSARAPRRRAHHGA